MTTKTSSNVGNLYISRYTSNTILEAFRCPYCILIMRSAKHKMYIFKILQILFTIVTFCIFWFYFSLKFVPKTIDVSPCKIRIQIVTYPSKIRIFCPYWSIPKISSIVTRYWLIKNLFFIIEPLVTSPSQILNT